MSSESPTLLESLGVAGAPLQTWQAIQDHFQDCPVPQKSLEILHIATHQLLSGLLVLVTDRQGDRQHARYGVVIHDSEQTVVSSVAFGPQFGVAGVEALQKLVNWAMQRNLVLRETVIPSSDLSRIMDEPDSLEVEQLLASSNPVDNAIYLQDIHLK